MKTNLRFGLATLVLPVALAVASQGSIAQVNEMRLSPTEAENVRQVVVAWLECHECVDGELAAVKRLGEVAVPTLGAVLRSGPSPAKLAAQRHHLGATYTRSAKSANKDEAPSLSQEQYVELYTGNLVALYKIRAAEALRAIGGARAQKMLEEATSDSNRADVASRIKAIAAGKAR